MIEQLSSNNESNTPQKAIYKKRNWGAEVRSNTNQGIEFVGPYDPMAETCIFSPDWPAVRCVSEDKEVATMAVLLQITTYGTRHRQQLVRQLQRHL